MRIELGYTSLSNEIKILEQQKILHPILSLESVVDVDEILLAQETIKYVHVSQSIKIHC